MLHNLLTDITSLSFIFSFGTVTHEPVISGQTDPAVQTGVASLTQVHVYGAKPQGIHHVGPMRLAATITEKQVSDGSFEPRLKHN